MEILVNPAEERSPNTTCPSRHPPYHCRSGTCDQEYQKCAQCLNTLNLEQQSVRSQKGILNPFYRFIGRFSGRRREPTCSGTSEGGGGGSSAWDNLHMGVPSPPGCDRVCCHTPTHPSTPHTSPVGWVSQAQLCLLYLVLVALLSSADACSSRSTPKPRPPSPTMRPNITFQTYACPPAYAAWYCLNGATCFTVKIGQSILYNCECADGFMGQRCEFKDLDGTYLSSSERLRMAASVRTAGSSVTFGVIVIIVGTAIGAVVFTRKRSRARMRHIEQIRRETAESCEMNQSGGCQAADREIWWREAETSPQQSPKTTSTLSTPSPYRPLEPKETEFCFYQSISGSLDNLSYKQQTASSLEQPSTPNQSASSRASTSSHFTNSQREGSPSTPPSNELPKINLNKKSHKSVPLTGSPFLTPIRASLYTPHSEPKQSSRRWWRRFRVEDEEQAVMKGTISYAMSQTRDQQSMDSNNSARDYECLRGQTPQMSGDPAQVLCSGPA